MKTGREGLEIGSAAHFVHEGDPACYAGTVVKTWHTGASVLFEGVEHRTAVELGHGHSDWHKPEDCPFAAIAAPDEEALRGDGNEPPQGTLTAAGMVEDVLKVEAPILATPDAAE